MQFSTVILALAATVAASPALVERQAAFDPAQATISLFAALPTDIQAIALANPSAAAGAIAAQFAAGVPTWFTVLPTAVQSYFLAQQAPAATVVSSVGSVLASITSAVGPVSTGGIVGNVSSAIVAANSTISSSIIRTNGTSTSRSTVASSTRSTSTTPTIALSSNAASMDTAFQLGAAGVAGLVALFAL